MIIQEYQYNYLIKKRIRCIGIDQRGFGKSDRPTCGYDYDTLSDDVKSVVDQLCLENFILLGHSTGGAIAVRYMARHDGVGVDKLIYDLMKIEVQTLILHGIHDEVCLFPLAEEQKKRIKNSKLIKFLNSGHGIFYDERDKFNEIIVNFIEE